MGQFIWNYHGANCLLHIKINKISSKAAMFLICSSKHHLLRVHKVFGKHLTWMELHCLCMYNAYISYICSFLGHRSQRLQWPIVITRCPASVVRPSVCRPSSVRLFTFSTSSPEPLDGFWWNLVWMKYSRSLTSVVVFRPDPPRGGSRMGPKIGQRVPFLKNFFFKLEGYSNKPNA